jgi:ATP-dependent exoDNAse (exonuclease V) alpha subunit
VAILYLRTSTIKRSAGRTAIAAAAYRAAVALDDPRTGERHDFTRKRGVAASGLVGWTGTRAELWAAAEKAERRRDATVAREVVIALPHELPPERAAALLRDFVEWIARRHGCAADWSLHLPSREGDRRNLHGHILLTTRRSDGARLTGKTRELDDRKAGGRHLRGWRAEWARRARAALAEIGIAADLDPRPYAAQAREKRIPALLGGEHLGPAHAALARRGAPVAAALRNATRQAINAEIRAWRRALDETLAAVIDEAASAGPPQRDQRAR